MLPISQPFRRISFLRNRKNSKSNDRPLSISLPRVTKGGVLPQEMGGQVPQKGETPPPSASREANKLIFAQG